MSHIESKDLNMYRITPPPPKWDLQEYIRLYVQTGNDKYFYWFLHCYEPQMNYLAKEYRKTYKMAEHFADIKQAMAYGLCKALVNYDISKSPFFPYANRYMEREAHNYIRTMRTGYSIQSEFEYARLRKAMAIYKNLGGEFTEETISQVATQIGESYEKTKSIIEGGILTENYTDVQSNDEDDEQTIDFLLPDSSLNPENIYFKQELYDKLYEAYDSLEYTEKIMLAQHLGFCPECFSTHYAKENLEIEDKQVIAKNASEIGNNCDEKLETLFTKQQVIDYINSLSQEDKDKLEQQIHRYKTARKYYSQYVHNH